MADRPRQLYKTKVLALTRLPSMNGLPTLILVASAMMHVHAQTVDRVLSLPFGKPLDRNIARCPTTAERVIDYCGLSSGYKAGAQHRDVSIMLLPPPAASPYAVPSWVASEIVHVKFDAGGSIARIAVSTDGPAEQDRVIESIAARFGQPTAVTATRKQNAFGAAVLVKQVIWTLPTLVIYHDCLKFRRCTVSFSVHDDARLSTPRKPPPSTP